MDVEKRLVHVEWIHRDVMRKAKARLELSLAKNIKDNNHGFYKYISSKMKIWKTWFAESEGWHSSNWWHRVGEITNIFFASGFTAEGGSQES